MLIHSDMDVPFAKEGSQPVYLEQMKALFRRHPHTTIIWAHTGMGRVVRPDQEPCRAVGRDSRGSAVQSRLLRYFLGRGGQVRGFVSGVDQISADLINRYPDRFLFGTDEVAPDSQEKYLRVY